MKMRMLMGAMLFCFCGLMFAGQKAEITGKELLDKMNSSARGDQDFVSGYVQAVYATYQNKSTLATEEEIKPVIKAAKTYLENNRQRLDQPANVLLKESFAKNIPAKKK